MALYKLQNNPITGKLDGVIKNPDASVRIIMPIAPENSDYQKYLEWKAIDGNEPEAAD